MRKFKVRLFKFMALLCPVILPLQVSAQDKDAGEIVFQQDFSKRPGIEKEGWTVNAPADVFLWSEGNDGLLLKFRHSPYKGGAMSHEVPISDDEELTLDVTIGCSYSDYQHFSLRFEFENILFGVKNLMGSHILLRHSPKGNTWTTISGEVPLGKRMKFRIVSHRTGKGRSLQYFIDDMRSPVFMEDGVDPLPFKDGRAHLSIGNYGLSLGEVTHVIHSITLRRLPCEQEGGTIELQKGTASLFLGVAYERHRAADALKALGVSDVQTYAIINKSPNLNNRNTFRIDRTPPAGQAKIREYIVMADFPMNKGILPAPVVEGIKRDVREGSTLVVLGGLCTLNKGEFQESGLRELIPLDMSDPWAVKTLEYPELLPGGRIRYVHRLVPDDPKDVVSAVDGNPIWVARSYGKGRVVVFLGMPCGTSSGRMFWEVEDWPRYAAGMISSKSIR